MAAVTTSKDADKSPEKDSDDKFNPLFFRRWPKFLIKPRNQSFWGMASLIFTIFVLPIGLGMSAYYLFVLDSSNKKSKVALGLNLTSLLMIIAATVLGFWLHGLLLS